MDTRLTLFTSKAIQIYCVVVVLSVCLSVCRCVCLSVCRREIFMRPSTSIGNIMLKVTVFLLCIVLVVLGTSICMLCCLYPADGDDPGPDSRSHHPSWTDGHRITFQFNVFISAQAKRGRQWSPRLFGRTD